MKMKHGQQPALSPEKTLLTLSEVYLKNQVSTISMKLPIKYLYLSQSNSKKIEYIV